MASSNVINGDCCYTEMIKKFDDGDINLEVPLAEFKNYLAIYTKARYDYKIVNRNDGKEKDEKAERKRQEKEKAERKRQEHELAERKRKEEEEARKRQEEALAERKRQEEEEARKREEEKMRKEEEARKHEEEKIRKEEEEKIRKEEAREFAEKIEMLEQLLKTIVVRHNIRLPN